MGFDLGYETNSCHPGTFRFDSSDVSDLPDASQEIWKEKLEAGMVLGFGDLLADLGYCLSLGDTR